jgi:predicted nucleic acid-binding protein
MNGYLLDTNVISEFNRRGEPDPVVRRWLESADTNALNVSVLTLGEIRFGVNAMAPGKRRTQLERWIDYDLPEWFEGRILPVDRKISDYWGALRAQAQAIGRPLSVIDALLAATALHHKLTLVSRNVSDFVVEGLAVVNPWEATKYLPTSSPAPPSPSP